MNTNKANANDGLTLVCDFTVFPEIENNLKVINWGINLKESISINSFYISNCINMGEAIDELLRKVDSIERAECAECADEVTFGNKMCPTRHGCTGATNCNYEYASYPG